MTTQRWRYPEVVLAAVSERGSILVCKSDTHRGGDEERAHSPPTVSYTHLDVYKRQTPHRACADQQQSMRITA